MDVKQEEQSTYSLLVALDKAVLYLGRKKQKGLMHLFF